MKEKFDKFMQGRYGTDQFSRFILVLSLISVIVSMLTRRFPMLSSVLDLLAFAGIIYTYFRMFSRNIQKRYGENQKYLSMTYKLRMRFHKEKNIMEQRKTHHIYSCPGCGQKIRIPRGKGKIEIECPKCHTKFVKRS